MTAKTIRKNFYIGERNNPQLSKSYFVAYGKLTKKEAIKKEDSSYGSMWLTAYTKEEYEKKIEELKSNGFTVNVRQKFVLKLNT